MGGIHTVHTVHTYRIREGGGWFNVPCCVVSDRFVIIPYGMAWHDMVSQPPHNPLPPASIYQSIKLSK